ncbi:MAG: hypothetical protein P4L56_08080 [Candidatus Sulfopaludibacter sp.]|nr:hypothetical protein [Candidatus Sulfopaludibacter sp.]
MRVPLVSCLTAFAFAAWAQPPEHRTVFSVRYVAQGAIYIDAGTAEGIAPGMVIEITRHEAGAAIVDRQPVATAVVTAVATASAVCEIQSQSLEPAKGDEARLSAADEMNRVRTEVNQSRRHYLQVLEFSDGDPLDDEMREYVPRPPLEEVNRLRGRIAFERTAIIDHDSPAASSSENGMVIRIDWSRIEGSYWTLTGYWRGSLTSNQSASQTTLLDLMNRTYQIGLFYANPLSPWKFGIGRLILPWASSLGAIDGGYAARKISRKVTLGMFAGTNPDPTQWNYAPNRQTSGVFVNYETGSYDGAHWSSTAGIAFSRVNWRPERQYIFIENNYSIGRTFSIFQTAQADYRDPKLMNGATGAQLSQSFITIRYTPRKRVSFDVSDNYFRGVPTFDQRLIGTGLLDQYLFTGISGGVRFEPIDNLLITANLGNSRRNGDTSHAVNQAYGITWKRLPVLDLRLNLRYNSYSSSFGTGSYESAGITRELSDALRLQFEAGIQNTQSTYSSQTRARFFNSMIDWQLGRHYFVMGNWLSYRGLAQNYDQISISLGYRFGK